jgi:solute carrier family 25 carnitine/acylcarnitine transporter 20/29
MSLASDSTIHQTHYKGPIDCLRQIVAKDGWSRVFTGLKPTMVRESIGVTCWFSAYEGARRWFYQKNGGVLPSGWQIALCGTAGGVAFWSVAYPFDTVKSRLQAQGPTSVNPYKGVVDCLVRVAKEEGPVALYQGYSTAVVRASFVGAAVFYTYEVVRSALG